MGAQDYVGNKVYRWGVRQRNKIVMNKHKSETVKRVAKDAARVGAGVIRSYNPPDYDPFTGVQIGGFHKSHQKRQQKRHRKKRKKIVVYV